MYSFNNDYSESAHPNILGAILSAGLEQNNGYGNDSHCEHARQLIRKRMKDNDADIHFMPGGTITNATFISHVLLPYQAVISADTGHINIHETGAIEASGHKVIAIPSPDGKLNTEMIRPVLEQHEDEHWVQPAMVYISNPTEMGTIYSQKELKALHQFCKDHNLLFYLDGARLAMGLTANGSELSISDLPKYTDAFYIGGTKVGALFGEALVIINPALKKDFRHSIKQHGAMTAKGWLIGLQFEELFSKDLYYEMGEHANHMAGYMRDVIDRAGYSFLADTRTNQMFPILPNWLVDALAQKYIFSIWSKPDTDHTCIRLCTSWATSHEAVMAFCDDFRTIIKTKYPEKELF